MKSNCFYVISTGPAGPNMATLQALNTIKQMDFIVATEELAKLFAEYIGEKPVLFNPWKGFWHYKGEHYLKLGKEEMVEFRKERFRLRDERIKIIKEYLVQGKNVALLDSSNPCLFSPNHWYLEQFEQDDIIIIPGMGCDTAAMAALGKSIIPAYDTRFVMQTAPVYLKDWDIILKDLSQYPVSMVMYMSLEYHEKLFAGLKTVYSSDMPCAVVYWAGYPDKQQVVRGTIADIEQKISKIKEKYMGLLFVGRFLEGKPYEATMRRQ